MRTIIMLVIASVSITASAEPQAVIGFDAELLPKVDNHIRDAQFSGADYDGEGPTAYAIGAIAEWNVLRWLAVGVAPRYIIGLVPVPENGPSTQIDLRARIELGWNVTHAVRLYSFFEPGYSIISATNAGDSAMPPSAGAFSLEVGAGARFAVKPGFAIAAEVGYQLMQSIELTPAPFDDMTTFREDFLSVSLGFVTPLF
jgi:hypothetical protein